MYYLIFILALFSSVGFFNYHGMLSDQMQRGIFYAVSCVALLLAVTERNNRVSDFEFPRYAYWTVIGSLLFSVLMVHMYHGQPLGQSVIATLPYIFAYIYLYVLIKFRLSYAIIIKILIGVSALGIPVYFCNLISFPVQVFGVENPDGADFSRGMLRVSIPFFEALVLIFFYAMQQWKESSRKVWLVYIGIGAIMIILSLTRQIIVVVFGLALWYALRGLTVIKKIMVIAVCVIAGIVIVNKVPIFQAMIELSEAHAEIHENDEDIRIKAWRYYTYENQEGIATVLFGNGVPSIGNSSYGIQVQQNMEETKCLAVDVGWAGFFHSFGLFGVLALFGLLVCGVVHAKLRGKEYLSLWLLFIIITAVASGPVLLYYQILILMIGLYLVYVPDEDSSHNTELQ